MWVSRSWAQQAPFDDREKETALQVPAEYTIEKFHPENQCAVDGPILHSRGLGTWARAASLQRYTPRIDRSVSQH
jgi:hypothetical protein